MFAASSVKIPLDQCLPSARQSLWVGRHRVPCASASQHMVVLVLVVAVVVVLLVSALVRVQALSLNSVTTLVQVILSIGSR